MKKAFLALAAIAISFASIAQDKAEKKGSDKKDKAGKHQKHRGDFGGAYAEKLNLTDAQKAQLKTINENFRNKMQSLRSNTSLTEEQRKEQRQALVKEHQIQIQGILTPEQRKQAEQFKSEHKKDWKDRGDKNEREGKDRKFGKREGGFEKLEKELNLNADQSSKAKAINETFRNDMKSLRSNTSLTQEQKKEQAKALQQKHREELQSLLTADQKNKLKEKMKNRPNRRAVK